MLFFYLLGYLLFVTLYNVSKAKLMEFATKLHCETDLWLIVLGWQ